MEVSPGAGRRAGDRRRRLDHGGRDRSVVTPSTNGRSRRPPRGREDRRVPAGPRRQLRLSDAIDAALGVFRTAATQVCEARMVALSARTYDAIVARLEGTP
jgi:hypothetical protein